MLAEPLQSPTGGYLPGSVSHRANQAATLSCQVDDLLQAMPSGIVLIDETGLVTHANPVALDLLGEPLTGQRWRDIITRAFAPQDDDGHEVSLQNGRRVKLAMTPLTANQGQMIVLTDLTETRLLQKNLAHLQRLSALGKMVASLAHQVRTPLSAALLYASNLASPALSQHARDKFQHKLIARLNDLEQQVNDMLLMARGRQDAMAEPLTLGEICTRVQENCEAILNRRNVVLTLDNTSQGYLLGNSSALSSAVGNLVINSLEAGADQIALVGRQSENQLQLSVRDNGSGLSAQLQQKVLEPFFTTKSQGTGLGLAVVQSVVHQHGGSLTLNCEAEVGCVVTVSLPCQGAYMPSKVQHSDLMEDA